MVSEELQKAIQAELKTLGIKTSDVHLEHPADLTHGDYSTNVALVYAKQLKAKPKELAERLLQGLTLNLQKGLTFVSRIEIAGAGFINFHLSKEFFADSVKSIGEDFGKNKKLGGKKVMVEYTDPNPFKEFHIGHLMSNAVGESLARLFEFQSAKVVRACWQGDVGLHVAKAIWGRRKEVSAKGGSASGGKSEKLPARRSLGAGGKVKSLTTKDWGEAYTNGSEAYETDESAKKEINELNKKIFERSDAEANKLYDAGRKVSLEHFEEIYKTLGTKFDYYFFEGREGREGQPIVEDGLAKGIFERSERAVVYRGEKQGLHTRVFLTKENLPTYETKELGLNKAKFEKEPDLDESVIVTANEQSDYFKVVLAAMKEVLPEIAKKTKHIAHGMLRFASGKMSSRKGNVITGEGLIEQVKKRVLEKVRNREMPKGEKEKLAEIVAVGAIKYSILRQAIGGDIIFDFEKSISFEGDSGPYLQYSYVRAKSVLQKAKEHHPLASRTRLSPSTEGERKEGGGVTTLEHLLYRFPEIVERAGNEYQPHHVATFLIELAGAFNSWYAKEKIVDVDDPSSPYKVALTSAFATVMQNGLWLLGIKVPERM